MSLNADIQSMIEGVRAKAPPRVFETLGAMFGRLEGSGVAQGAPKSGDPVPNVTLVGADGAFIDLKPLYADKPLILLFYRGRWCPFCDLTLRAFQKAMPEFAAAGVALAAVSPQTPDATAMTASERNLSYPLYSDPGNAASQAFGLDWQVQPGAERTLYEGFGAHVDQANGDDEWRLPAPAAFVIDKVGIIRWAWADSNWTRRAEPEDVLKAVRAMQT